MLTRGGPCAEGVLLTGLGGATGHGHAPSTTGLRLSSLRQTAIARGSEPSDRLPARLLRWRPRRRIAYLAWADRAWADRVRRPIVSLDTACTTARGGAHHKAKTGVKGRTAYRKFKGDCLKKIPA